MNAGAWPCRDGNPPRRASDLRGRAYLDSSRSSSRSQQNVARRRSFTERALESRHCSVARRLQDPKFPGTEALAFTERLRGSLCNPSA